MLVLCLVLRFLAGFTVGTGLIEVGREYVHQRGLGNGCDLKVGHGVVHSLHEGRQCAFQVTGLNQLIGGRAFLDGGLLIDGDKFTLYQRSPASL